MNSYYLSLKPEIPPNDYWAYGLINDVLPFKKHEVDKLPKAKSALVVIPGEYHADLVDEINLELKNINNSVVFIMADEESKFPVERLKANHIWVQFPHPGRHDAFGKLPSGYPAKIKSEIQPKGLNVFFAGQLTHKRRMEMWSAVQDYCQGDAKCDTYGTKGFTQGYPHDEYSKKMASAKIVPCPAGTITPDSFRVFESLELMAIPIADQDNSQGDITDYWEWFFGEQPPFPLIKDWTSFAGYTNEVLEAWPANMHRQTAWWIKWKRDFKNKVLEQLYVA